MSLLDIQGLTRRFGRLVASDGVSLKVASGGIHALIGPNGAGKSTLINQLSGALRSDAGRVVFDGHDVTPLAMHERVARGLARSYQVTNIFKRFSALDNVALAVQARSGSSLRFWRPVSTETALFDEAAAVLDRVGPRVVVEVGPAEPLAGQGPEESARMVDLLQRLHGQVTMLLVEHDMDAVFRLADTVSVLVYGRIIATGTPGAIRANDDVHRAYLGDDAALAAVGNA